MNQRVIQSTSDKVDEEHTNVLTSDGEKKVCINESVANVGDATRGHETSSRGKEDTNPNIPDKEKQEILTEMSLNQDTPIPNVDNELKSWLVVAGASLIMAMTFGMINTYGIYQTYYETRYPHIDSTTLGIIGALQAALTYLVAVPSAVIMHYTGPQLLIFTGGLISCLSFMFLSISNSPWQLFIIQGLMFGIGSGLMYIQATYVTLQYFSKKKALATGLMTAGSSCAGVYWPIGVRNLISKVGFAWANRIVGFLYIPMFLSATYLLKPRFPPAPRKPGQNILRINFKVLKDWRFELVNLGNFFALLGLFPGLFYIDLFCERLSISPTIKEYNVTILNASSLFGRIIPGLVGDRFGRMNTLIPCLIVAGVTPMAIWIPARSNGAVLAFTIVWGFSSGVLISLFPAIIGEICPAKDMSSYLAILFGTSSVAALVGPIIGGVFVPKGNVEGVDGFNKLGIFVGVCILGSALVIAILRIVYTKKFLTIIRELLNTTTEFPGDSLTIIIKTMPYQNEPNVL